MGLPTWVPALIASVVVLAVAAVLWFRLRRRPTAEELERMRRLAIHRTGKMGDGEIVDVDGPSILYSYTVAGVLYTTSQDAASLEERLPSDRMSMLGPVLVKFDPRNPANSIVLCEEWSGLRHRQPSASGSTANV